MLKFFKNEHTNITDADRELDSKSFGEIQVRRGWMLTAWHCIVLMLFLGSLIVVDADAEKVIGAGLPRTGTLSLKTALTQLYGGAISAQCCTCMSPAPPVGKCYHMMNVIAGKQEDVDIWFRAFRGEVGMK
jgi:hypothetical protein